MIIPYVVFCYVVAHCRPTDLVNIPTVNFTHLIVPIGKDKALLSRILLLFEFNKLMGLETAMIGSIGYCSVSASINCLCLSYTSLRAWTIQQYSSFQEDNSTVYNMNSGVNKPTLRSFFRSLNCNRKFFIQTLF